MFLYFLFFKASPLALVYFRRPGLQVPHWEVPGFPPLNSMRGHGTLELSMPKALQIVVTLQPPKSRGFTSVKRESALQECFSHFCQPGLESEGPNLLQNVESKSGPYLLIC